MPLAGDDVARTRLYALAAARLGALAVVTWLGARALVELFLMLVGELVGGIDLSSIGTLGHATSFVLQNAHIPVFAILLVILTNQSIGWIVPIRTAECPGCGYETDAQRCPDCGLRLSHDPDPGSPA